MVILVLYFAISNFRKVKSYNDRQVVRLGLQRDSINFKIPNKFYHPYKPQFAMLELYKPQFVVLIEPSPKNLNSPNKFYHPFTPKFRRAN